MELEYFTLMFFDISLKFIFSLVVTNFSVIFLILKIILKINTTFNKFRVPSPRSFLAAFIN